MVVTKWVARRIENDRPGVDRPRMGTVRVDCTPRRGELVRLSIFLRLVESVKLGEGFGVALAVEPRRASC